MKKNCLYFKVLAIAMILVSIFSANSSVVCAKENIESVISDAKFTELFREGLMVKEDNAYSFTKTAVFNSLAKDSQSNQQIIQDKLIIIPITDEGKKNLEELLAARANNSTTLYQSDVAGCISANLTIYWAVGTANGKETAILKSVSGGFSAQGSGSYVGSNVYVTGQEVTMGTSGITTSGPKSQSSTKNPDVSTRSFSYNAPSSWIPVYAESNVATVGAYYNVTLTRGSSSWPCTISNNVGF